MGLLLWVHTIRQASSSELHWQTDAAASCLRLSHSHSSLALIRPYCRAPPPPACLLPARPPPAKALRTRRPRCWSQLRLALPPRSLQPRRSRLPAARLSAHSGPFLLILRPWAVPPPPGLAASAPTAPYSSLLAAAFSSAPLLFLPLLDHLSAPPGRSPPFA